MSKEDDPLWDEPKPILMGIAYYKLEPLGYLMNNPLKAAVINYNNINYPKVGILDIDVIPHDEHGNEYEEVPENPNELVGKSIQYTVAITEISDLQENFCKSIYVEYESFYNKNVNVTKSVRIIPFNKSTE